MQHLSESRSVEGGRSVLARQVQVVQHFAGFEHQRHALDSSGVKHPVDLLAEQLDSGALLTPGTCLLQGRHQLRMIAQRMKTNTR